MSGRQSPGSMESIDMPVEAVNSMCLSGEFELYTSEADVSHIIWNWQRSAPWSRFKMAWVIDPVYSFLFSDSFLSSFMLITMGATPISYFWAAFLVPKSTWIFQPSLFLKRLVVCGFCSWCLVIFKKVKKIFQGYHWYLY